MRRPILPCLLAAAALAGCGATAARSSAGNCLGGTCGPAVSSTLRLAAELIPPAEMKALGRQEFTAVHFDGTGTAHLSLPARLPVSGRFLDEDAKLGISAVITATRTSSIPGLPSVSRSTSTGANGNFSIELTEGTWQLRMLPQGDSQERFAPESRTVEVRAGLPQLDVAASARRTLAGSVTSALGTGLGKVSVRVTDLDTGNLVSSVATTGESGEFMLALASDTANHDHLSLVAEGGDLPASVSIARALDGPTAVSVGHVDLHAPPLASLQPVVIPLLGRTPSGADKAVVGARVDVWGDLSEKGSSTTTTLAVSAVSDGEGNVAFNLVPGGKTAQHYLVTITPVSDSMFVRGAFEVPVSSSGVQKQLQLEARPTVTGQVLGPDGNPLGNAVVAPQAAAALGVLGAQAYDALLPQTVTDPKDGRFLLRLEINAGALKAYDLLITPAYGSGLGIGWLADQVITGDVELPPVRLPSAASATVLVVDPAGNPVPGCEIRLYSDVAGSDCPGDTGCRRPRLRADATSDASGAVRVLIGAP